MGHWARTCTNPPDERAKARGHYFMQDPGPGPAPAPAPAPAQHGRFFIAAVLANFIGLTVQAGTAVFDSGAQTGVIGLLALGRLEETLKKVGLRIYWISRNAREAVGIGGTARPRRSRRSCRTASLRV